MTRDGRFATAAVEGEWFHGDARIKNLKSTTFQGTRFTRLKLADI